MVKWTVSSQDLVVRRTIPVKSVFFQFTIPMMECSMQCIIFGLLLDLLSYTRFIDENELFVANLMVYPVFTLVNVEDIVQSAAAEILNITVPDVFIRREGQTDKKYAVPFSSNVSRGSVPVHFKSCRSEAFFSVTSI